MHNHIFNYKIFPPSLFKGILLPFFILPSLFAGCKEDQSSKEKAEVAYEDIDAAFNNKSFPILFNHLYVTLDSTTFANLKNNEFLASSYANLDRGMPDFNKLEPSANSFYLRGKSHYIEILGPGNKFGEPTGKMGIGFQLDNDEEFQIRKKLDLPTTSKTFLTATDTATYNIKGEEVLWYQPFYTTGNISTEVYTWYAQYNPEFLKKLYGTNVNIYSREEFLKPGYDGKKFFHSVSKLEIVCNQADFKRIAMELQLLDHQWEKKGDEFTTQLNDIDLVLHLRSELDQSYLKAIHCKLNENNNNTLDFGNLLIKNSGKQSIWEFKNH
ncbi:DUF5829 family protein [Autumnicola musiva]|uniref:DUF5829 family protein n=1 Tax=Autumnicola musiva TaxID=3075589 RepID=A0ABU3DAH2_9FLAO|nr:DUF5829 family protein [Zunongwangia sp. F117]MDT0678541.1 DUF5829 family protein [Zunongwangia sp. F117]